MQHFQGCLQGVGDAVGEPPGVPAASWGRYLVVGGVPRRLSVLAVVVPFHCPPGVPMFENVYFRGGWGCIHCFPTDKFDGADCGVGHQKRLHKEDLADVLADRSRARGNLCRLG